MIVLQLKGVLTKAECKLAESEDGTSLIKQIRTKLLEGARPVLEKMIEKIVEVKIISMHSDISTRTGERIIVFSFNENLEDKFKK